MLMQKVVIFLSVTGLMCQNGEWHKFSPLCVSGIVREGWGIPVLCLVRSDLNVCNKNIGLPNVNMGIMYVTIG